MALLACPSYFRLSRDSASARRAGRRGVSGASLSTPSLDKSSLQNSNRRHCSSRGVSGSSPPSEYVFTLVIVTATPGSTAPDVSLIVPEICPVWVCAAAGTAAGSNASIHPRIMTPPPSTDQSTLDPFSFEFDDHDRGHGIEHRPRHVERRLAALGLQLEWCVIRESIRAPYPILDSGDLERRARLAEKCEVELPGLRRDAPFGLRQEELLTADVLRAARAVLA